MPITVRIPYGGGIGAVEHHSESPEAYFAHTPGLRVVTCGGPQDAHTMLRQAIASDDPVIFLEPKRRYWVKDEVDESLDGALPLDRARVVVSGTDVTLAAYGPLVLTARDVAIAAADEGLSVEVVDLRSLSPLDLDTLEASVRKTGRLVVTHEAQQSGGLGAEIAASITERCWDVLRAPVARVTGFDTPYPPAKAEEHFLPDLDRLLDAVDRVVGRPHSLSGWRAS
jgi:2-oxoisovalerate dehydrogenase E1 component beta subunit